MPLPVQSIMSSVVRLPSRGASLGVFLGALLGALLVAGCGSEIGDSCSNSLDCSPNRDRTCERSTSSPGGYCTVVGCDYGTCPDEAVCVRFFSSVSSKTCDPATEDIDDDRCSPDELCTLAGTCEPRQAEIRYCMRRCGDQGDCREDYECRDQELMLAHGGEPVSAPGTPRGDYLPAFCAVAPAQ